MKSTASPKIRIFLSRRDGENNAYHTINDVCQKYPGVVLEDYHFNQPANFQKKTLEECALEDDIIVFLITKGEPSERQTLDDPRLKKFLQRGRKVWVFYRLSEKKTTDYQNGKVGPDRWYYERTDPKIHPNDDYVVLDYFGVNENGYDQSLYAQFDRRLSTYVRDTRNRKWIWIWALITILVIRLAFLIGRPHINKFFHPEPIEPKPDSLVVFDGDTIVRADSDSTIQTIEVIVSSEEKRQKQQSGRPTADTHSSNLALGSSKTDNSQEDKGDKGNSEAPPTIIPLEEKPDSTPSQLEVAVNKTFKVGDNYNGERIVILNSDCKSGYVGILDNSGPISYPDPDELARRALGWGLPTIEQMKQIYENRKILNFTGTYWTSGIGASKNKRKVVDFSKECFTVQEIKTSNDREAYMLLIKDFVIDK